MGKKDEEIKRQKAMADELRETNTMLLAKCKSLAAYNAQHTGDIAALNENHNKAVAELQKQIQELTEFRQLMVVNVNITGVQDIDKCLSDATSLVTKRLEELGKLDDYVILAVPHTMAISIPR
jgi:hypothetical protein